MDGKAFIQEHINKMKCIQEEILVFLDNDESNENDLTILIQNFDDKQQFRNNKQELRILLHLLLKISNNHHRTSNFFFKIEKIIKTYQSCIVENFTNYDIFNIFKSNKRILLFLFDEKILVPDYNIFHMITKKKYIERYYPHYFFKEFKNFYDEELTKQIQEEIEKEGIVTEKFDEFRKSGENHTILSKMIRNDQIEDFIIYINKTNIPLHNTKLNNSIFETNSYLLKKSCPSLIEYATFFGSIRIFDYLKKIENELTPTLWGAAIHSNNQEIFCCLEDNKVESYNELLIKEAIKCHHIDFITYIIDNKNIEESPFAAFVKNYDFIHLSNDCYPSNMNESDIFNFYCKYDYFYIVEFFVNNNCIDINEKIV